MTESIEAGQPVQESVPQNEPLLKPRDGAAAAFVWSVFGILLVMFLCLAYFMNDDIPHWDEWEFVPYVTGNKPITLSWIFSLHNEHPIPISRIIYITLAWLTHGDSRSEMYFNVLLLGLTAAVCVIAARRIRGHTTYTDAFFPMLWLNYGHSWNALWAFQIPFIMGSCLAIYLLAAFCRRDDGFENSAVKAAVALLLLPMSGGNGLAMSLPLAVPLAIVAWRMARASNKTRKRRGIIVLALVAATAVIAIMYGTDIASRPRPYDATGPLSLLIATAQFYSMAFGPIGMAFWPLIGWILLPWPMIALAVLVIAWRKNAAERARIIRLACFLGATLAVALSIGFARGNFQNGGLQPHYPVLAAPLLCWCYMAWELFGGRNVRNIAQNAVYLLLASLFVFQMKYGFDNAQFRHVRAVSVHEGIRAGVLPEEIAAKVPSLYPKPDILAERLEMLKQAKMGPYRNED